VIAIHMLRMEGRTPIFTFVQFLTGAATGVCLLLPLLLMTTIAFRPDRDRELTVTLNDALAFFFHSGPFGWRGIVIFWLALMAYSVFLVVMGVVLRGAIRESAAADAEGADAMIVTLS